jgi:hypothetical protein
MSKKEILLYEADIITDSQLVENGQGTETGDIARTDPKVQFGKPTVSTTLPMLLGYTQKLNAPAGFVFGLTRRDKTNIAGVTFPETPENPEDPANPEDLVIIRKYVETQERQVVIGTTNEVEQDIMTLFGDDFNNLSGPDHAAIQQKSGPTERDKGAKYFMEYGEGNLGSKINTDFINYLQTAASNKGSVTIDTYNDMHKVLGVIGELREALSKSTGKNGKPWIIVTPRIAAFISSTVGFISHNKGDWYNKNRVDPNTSINPYVGSYGDIDVYTMLPIGGHPGSSTPTTETSGEIIMGYTGGPGISSIYYAPYKKYIIKGGSDAYTGQSSVFYKIRDIWTTNPQDTLDHSNTGTTINEPNGDSKYLVKADLNFMEALLG